MPSLANPKNHIMKSQIIILLCFTIFNLASALNERDLDYIPALPGQPPVKFRQYSGYVTVNDREGRALFYWLTEATGHADTKPLVLWLNGGPGCSSIAYGASEEIGPFRINKTGSSLHLNKHSWNKEANLLFLESPAGVGFSYTNTTSNLGDTGDKRTAGDALVFLIRWMQRFPHYRHRDFYISGESYGGHYVPQLAKRIYDYNKKIRNPFINLKGFIVGNAVFDNNYDNVGTVEYWWSHSMISDHTYGALKKSCNFKLERHSDECTAALNYANIHEIGPILDQYSIYTSSCNASLGKGLMSPRFKNTLLRPRLSGYDPCVANYARIYFNREDVQKALHANTTRIPYKWVACSDPLFFNWTDSDFSMLPTYKKLLKAGLRIWVFSGDTDSIVPATATKLSLYHLHLKIKTPWYPWYTGGQVGGWTEVYDGLTFATVRGAGHEVPLFQPARALKLFQAFLAGKELPSKP